MPIFIPRFQLFDGITQGENPFQKEGEGELAKKRESKSAAGSMLLALNRALQELGQSPDVGRLRKLTQQGVDDVAGDIGETEVTPCMSEGEFFVIDAEQV